MKNTTQKINRNKDKYKVYRKEEEFMKENVTQTKG